MNTDGIEKPAEPLCRLVKCVLYVPPAEKGIINVETKSLKNQFVLVTYARLCIRTREGFNSS